MIEDKTVNTIRGNADPSPLQPMIKRTKHLGLLGADSIALYIDDTSEPFIFQVTRDITFGRYAPNAPVQPTVDLTAFGAYEKGVSRLHAAIRRTPSGEVQVEDMASGNGTWINGVRVEPHVPRVLKSGDQIGLGKLNIEIYMADTNQQTAVSGNAAAKDEALLKTLPVTANIPMPDQVAPVLQIAAPKPVAQYHASFPLGLQDTVNELRAVLVKIVPQLLRLKDCQIRLSLHIDAQAPSGFDESTIQAVKSAVGELKVDVSEFKTE